MQSTTIILVFTYFHFIDSNKYIFGEKTSFSLAEEATERKENELIILVCHEYGMCGSLYTLQPL